MSRVLQISEFVFTDLALNPLTIQPRLIWIKPIPWLEYGGEVFRDARRAERAPRFFDMPVDFMGYTPASTNEIWLRADRPLDLHFEVTVVHEVRHLHQKLNDPSCFAHLVHAEHDAHEYSFDAMERFFATQGALTNNLKSELAARLEQARNLVIRQGIEKLVVDEWRAILNKPI